MENASKALLMAGSVLMAILILGALVLLFNNIGIIPQSNDEAKAVAQLAEFNAQWESYNKKQMYGTDVITIINKAIENNKRYREIYIDDDESYKKYTVNVSIKITESLYVSYDVYRDGNIIYDGSDYIESEEYLKSGTYKLLSNYEKIQKLINGEQTEIQNKIDEFNYTVKHSGFSDFKRRYFKCTGITYKNTGTINTISFEQIGLTEY